MEVFTKSELIAIHNKLLVIFKDFHDFCVSNNLKYYMIGGTMLGALRHKGFIPWDDDIDVGMPREDYEKFLTLTKEISDNCVVEYPNETNKDYKYLYAKIFDKTTTLVENTRYPLKRGLFIDIFPIDGVGNDKEKAKKHYKKISKLIALESMIVCAYRKGRKWYKNLAILLGRIISPLFISERKINKSFDKLAKKYSYQDSKYVGNLAGNWGIKEMMPKSYLGKPTLYDFEGFQFYGVEDADKYLSSVYGNYMKLPLVEKRVTHHDYIEFDLNKSYLEE